MDSNPENSKPVLPSNSAGNRPEPVISMQVNSFGESECLEGFCVNAFQELELLETSSAVPETTDEVPSLTSDNDKCSICLYGSCPHQVVSMYANTLDREDFTEKATLQPCKHNFDLPCITDWILHTKIAPACPICRTVIETINDGPLPTRTSRPPPRQYIPTGDEEPEYGQNHIHNHFSPLNWRYCPQCLGALYDNRHVQDGRRRCRCINVSEPAITPYCSWCFGIIAQGRIAGFEGRPCICHRRLHEFSIYPAFECRQCGRWKGPRHLRNGKAVCTCPILPVRCACGHH